MSFWTPDNVIAATKGKWLSAPARGGFVPAISGLCTDSRSLKPGHAFLALKGDKFDGHSFVNAAADGGAPLIILSDAASFGGTGGARTGPAVLQVSDTLRALQDLAAAYRRSMPGLRVVGVTGSNGKTTTTRIIDAVLGVKFRGTRSIKSFNNHIGVPLTLLSVKPGDEYVVCEMGMNHPGEIAPLTAMAQPDAAVITSVGRAHIEHMGSIEAIAAEKASIFAGLRARGLAVAPADGEAPSLGPHLRGLERLVTVGASAGAGLRVAKLAHASGPEGDHLTFTLGDGASFTVPLIGEHNAFNAAAAVAVGRHFGLSDAEIARGLKAAQPPEMRLARETIRGIDLLNDAYNASPESMLAAFKTFAAVFPPGGRRRVLVLGDMLELGPASAAAHEEVGRAAAKLCRPDLLICVGAAAPGYAAGAGKGGGVHTFPAITSGQDADGIAALLAEGDAVLLKGSRRMGLERVVESLRGASAPAGSLTPTSGLEAISSRAVR